MLAIEPMVAMGRPETKVLADGWTAVTRDGSLAAHFEHTVAVTARRAAGADVAAARALAQPARSRAAAGRGWRSTGTVLAVLPRALYRVALDGGREVTAHAASGPGRNFVRLVVGDRVTVELTPRDVGRGRIVRRGIGSGPLREPGCPKREGRRDHEGQSVGEADL